DEPAVRLLIKLSCPVVDDLNACCTKFRILDGRYLLIGTVHEFSIYPIAIHIFAAIPGIGGAEDTRLRLLRHPCPRIAGDGPPAQPTPAHFTPRASLHDPLSGAIRILHHSGSIFLELPG